MLKRGTLAVLAIVLGGSFPSAAQIVIEEQPEPATWYRSAVARRASHRLDEKALLALKPEAIPSSLSEDLQKLDWLLVGAYSYKEKKLGLSYLEEKPCQLDVVRYTPEGDLEFQYAAPCADPERGKMYHGNFTMPPKVKTSVQQVKGQTYLEVNAYGAKEVHRVVSYRDGVLVVDISYDGKPNSKRVMYRDVRVSMPRGFNWKPAAK